MMFMKTIDEKIKNNVYKDAPPLAHEDQGSNPSQKEVHTYEQQNYNKHKSKC
jgi:hypothetical protein